MRGVPQVLCHKEYESISGGTELVLTTLEDMYETHQQGSQLLTVEGVLLLSNVHFDPSGGYVI